ncbi:hypothetical protein NOJ28_21580 [Neorhizobium galegae]|uniref:hypothetical protein n=1 Tax=Neorhizobium galegae TaxID=399 RepID=UPI0006212CF2|nr:hypothetical protein [Neorhizobium galegae]KAB1108685.1 hypothetical protein F4V89_29005 [Neorhizobium galegae]MCQ1768134.1 hypothetical protein [Neorhizobium galegae]MCQ1847106.1 hypothetical protein [Neorhizobium galegae]CDZ29957.1 Hypothetical protein NGAL_HAMBI490_48250 [Neorhizobium galegae bv. officinalis]
MSRFHDGAGFATAISLLVGTGGGYAINELLRTGQIIELEQEIARLKTEVQQRLEVGLPNDEEARAAIARSGRSIRMSECIPRPAVPDVTCTGIITTASGSFAGTKRPGVLSFARIDGAWTQIQ